MKTLRETEQIYTFLTILAKNIAKYSDFIQNSEIQEPLYCSFYTYSEVLTGSNCPNYSSVIMVDFRINWTFLNCESTPNARMVFGGGNSDSRLSSRFVAIRRSLLQVKCPIITIIHHSLSFPLHSNS